MLRCLIVFLFIILINPGIIKAQVSTYSVSKPWTYWWWMGSSVTKEGITENLEAFNSAGIGGVHIIPIYGEKGDEVNYLDFLSPSWMGMLKHTSSEAERLGMGVDMTAGTGWPFGGPDVKDEDVSKFLHISAVTIKDKPNVYENLNKTEESTLISVAGYDKDGNYCDLTSKTGSDGTINLINSNIYSNIYALFQFPTKQKVKRSAPGGEGYVLDYFSASSILDYMERFERAFELSGIKKGKIRAFYNDSYEVYGSNWTNNFLQEFILRRGYNLLEYTNYLADTSLDQSIRERVITDYCETVSDLLQYQFTGNWIKKSHEMGMITRYQAHGSPGNLLDLYALADIPETESFGASGFRIPGLRQDQDYEEESFGRPNPLTMKMASSASNVSGKSLVSAESTTWLGDHFKVSLSQIKPQIDELFVSGVNHVIFHGSTYSPPGKPFPGRLFYASTNYNQHSHFWNELPALNSYILKCQKVLQNSLSDNDILLYFPVHNMWKKQKTDRYIQLLDVHKSNYWLQSSNFGRLASILWDNGYTFDYISDKMIAGLTVSDGTLISGRSKYKVLVVPDIETMPVETLSMLKELANKGADIIFENNIPSEVPGLYDFENRREQIVSIKDQMLSLKPHVHVSTQVTKTLSLLDINREEMTSAGLEFIRKCSGDTTYYFISNLSNSFNEDWVELSTSKSTIEIWDMITDRRGKAATRKGKNGTEIYLQLPPGRSCILRCIPKNKLKANWVYLTCDKNNKFEIKGEWLLTPKGDNNDTPAPALMELPGSWTKLGGKYMTFSGKVIYTTSFELPASFISENSFLLDLGNVRETAKVKINGYDLELIWCLPYQTVIPEGIIKKINTIEIEVTNLSFNKVISLDKENVKWKDFHEINFVNIRYQPYDASDKTPEESGLLSMICLYPLKIKKP